MSTFFHILWNNVIPLTIMIGIGFGLERAFKLDIKTLSKLNFFMFSPAVIFKMIYESEMSGSVLLQVLIFFLIFMVLQYGIMEVVIRIKRYTLGMKSAMRNSVLFYNSGNYALPLNQLVFVGDPFTLSIQVIIMIMQALLPNTYGVYAVNAHKSSLTKTMRTIFTMPVIYAIPLAFFMKGFNIPIPAPIYQPIEYISAAFFATALTTLGIQLGSMKWRFNVSDVLLANFLRLCMGPVLGFVVIWMLGIHGTMAQALLLSCSVPTSLSSVLLAVEFDNEPEFASQTVFASTIFSIFTVAFVIYLFPHIS